MKSRTNLKKTLLPEEAILFLGQIFRKGWGCVLILIAVALAVSFITYHPADPSLNTAAENVPQNLLWYPGAIIADFLLQFFGGASFGIVLILLAWAIKFLLTKDFRVEAMNLGSAILSIFLFSFLLSVFKTPQAWEGLATFGGAFGKLYQILKTRFLLMTPLSSIPVILVDIFLACGWGGGGLISFIYALGGRWTSLKQGFLWGHKVGKNLFYSLHKKNLKVDLKESKGKEEAFFEKPFQEKKEDFSGEAFSLGQERDEDVLVEKDYPLSEINFSDSSEIEKQEEHTSVLAYSVQKKAAPSSLVLSYKDEYEFPSIDLLDVQVKKTMRAMTPEMIESSADQLETVLEEFGVRGEIENVRPGPVVTMYELKPAPGIKTSRVIGLADDIARSMSALSARIATVPGRNVIGIELPNPQRETVYMRDMLLSDVYQQSTATLPLILGKDIGGSPVIADLARMPHLLVAGTTGSGKSVSINTMILSILFKLSPDQCKFIMIDPKMLELSVYDDIPHLLAPVVTDPKKAVFALKWAVREMENRYRAMAKVGVRNIDGYNVRIREARASGELLMRRVQTGFDPDTGKPVFENQSLDLDLLPYIVVVVDEMADLMLVAGKEIEAAVQRLAQMARAAGIHLIMATQRPSVDVITGTIKANFPTRISFQVTSKIDSRTILGDQGAEQLLGQGDMLYMAGGGRVTRVHGPFIKDIEVERIVEFLKTQGEPSYVDDVTEDAEETFSEAEGGSKTGDQLYDQAVEIVMREGKASTSFVQRHLQIGYNRAARIIEQMEKEGIISAANHVGKREVLRRG
jgi:S-DNA-T family DNA segregation ATPase FtsK/SpoIIIE